ncbi:hypothetical protein [Paractinoplanes aksuensis]|nr:hypothetical protein [Actinoplanes aksuensis]
MSCRPWAGHHIAGATPTVPRPGRRIAGAELAAGIRPGRTGGGAP